eukprot:CAMPEP_0117512848 /NCGR_PEP_ID=MMETSP0784-20121206/29245_1 /TAXON_ID=39447 /ORGANISM="" /LENGTH=119 /DNA_ID=CAMNT_0005308585 /DNA_START=423 /DNA_END=782 /DNA_ORIENTATION=+
MNSSFFTQSAVLANASGRDRLAASSLELTAACHPPWSSSRGASVRTSCVSSAEPGCSSAAFAKLDFAGSGANGNCAEGGANPNDLSKPLLPRKRAGWAEFPRGVLATNPSVRRALGGAP